MSRRTKHHDRELSDPTPEQIRERSAEVRRRWSKRVAARRLAQAFSPWAPPLILASDLAGELNIAND